MGLTVLNLYRLTGSPADFARAIAALAHRVEAEGHPGVLSYRFYLDAPGATARAVVDYADAAAWIGHHDLAMAWPEMKALHAVAPLAEAVFLGEVAPEITDWLKASALKAQIATGFAPVAGFRRPG